MSKHKLETGFNFHRQGKLLEAMLMYKAFLEEEPDHFDALHLIGLLSYEMVRLKEAEGYFLRAIGLKPDFAQIYLSYARVLHDMERPEDEWACYDRAILIQPDDVEAHFSKGVLLQGLSRFDDALCAYDKAIAIDASLAESFVYSSLLPSSVTS